MSDEQKEHPWMAHSTDNRPPRPHYHPLNNPEAFIADWDRMIGTIADFAAKYNLPVPEMIVHPDIHMAMNAVARQRILGTLIYRGVKVRTGIFESATVLRER